MLVSLNPSISRNNSYSSKVNFKGENPFEKATSEAAAYCIEGDMIDGKIPKTEENKTFLNSTIEKCRAVGKKGIAFILNRAEKKWLPLK